MDNNPLDLFEGTTKKKKEYTYQYVLSDNVQKLSNYIVDKQKELQFNVPDIKLKRNDDAATREFLMNMTVEQRKELGISKTTLWHIRKNIREGKKIMLYEKVRSKMTQSHCFVSGCRPLKI